MLLASLAMLVVALRNIVLLKEAKNRKDKDFFLFWAIWAMLFSAGAFIIWIWRGDGYGL